ncbi:MAG: hypothetical protein ACOCXS_03290 [Bacteroidota bacterium]
MKQEITKNPAVYTGLKAFKDSAVYMLQPLNWYTTNFETELINAFFVGKTLYPEHFRPDPKPLFCPE